MCSQLLISGEAIKMNTGEMHQTSKALRTVLVDLRMGVLLLSGLFPLLHFTHEKAFDYPSF